MASVTGAAPPTQAMSRKDLPDIKPIILAKIPPAAWWFTYCPLGCIQIHWCAGWIAVGPNEEVAITHCGVVTGNLKKPGCFLVPCAGRGEKRVTTKLQAIDLPPSKIVDTTGSPILVSAIVNFRVVNAMQAMYGVEDYISYVTVNAGATLKNIVSKYSYNELKTGHETFNAELTSAAQEKLCCCGVEILEMRLNELNYAPEIAASLLKVQAATALLDARQLIVKGAVSIAEDAIKQLEAEGLVSMQPSEKVAIVKDLLIVTCSETDATPTVNVGSV